jgi:PKHD-type hydroxylase
MTEVPYMIWESAFSENNIKNIIEQGEAQILEKAITFAGEGSEIRKSKVSWFSDNLDMRDQLWDFILEANRQWGFDVSKYADIQYTVYEGTDNGHYNWHADVDWASSIASQRKISLTVQLSDPSEYEGGDFHLQGAQLAPNYKMRGTVLAFPSYQYHMVSPVTSGIRRSLVAWFEGPSWR